ncbi:hypothetical protein PVAP13_8KG161102 [Panicum virgatum]|uniref:Uncharacterized protein n=1 Tax=Panicum virgatum TaxID=38727 RepID=A0A8T0PGP4_PANVG|nr:hypothetical protein PVAP13_8KG161102 [Panicum virgatum]
MTSSPLKVGKHWRRRVRWCWTSEAQCLPLAHGGDERNSAILFLGLSQRCGWGRAPGLLPGGSRMMFLGQMFAYIIGEKGHRSPWMSPGVLHVEPSDEKSGFYFLLLWGSYVPTCY